MKSTVEIIDKSLFKNKNEYILHLEKFIKNNIKDIDDALYFLIYKWYHVDESISIKTIKYILKNNKINDLYIKNKFKNFGCITINDEIIYLKTWKRRENKIIPRNFVKYIDYIREKYNTDFEKFILSNKINFLDKIKLYFYL